MKLLRKMRAAKIAGRLAEIEDELDDSFQARDWAYVRMLQDEKWDLKAEQARSSSAKGDES